MWRFTFIIPDILGWRKSFRSHGEEIATQAEMFKEIHVKQQPQQPQPQSLITFLIMRYNARDFGQSSGNIQSFFPARSPSKRQSKLPANFKDAATQEQLHEAKALTNSASVNSSRQDVVIKPGRTAIDPVAGPSGTQRNPKKPPPFKNVLHTTATAQRANESLA